MGLSQRRERLVQRLKHRKSRVREGSVLVEGVRAVSEVLDAGARVHFAVCAPDLDRTTDGVALRERLAVSVPCESVSDVELRALAATESPQGVLLVSDEPKVELADALQGDVLVLDGVQDPGNVGTLVRSAVAFGFAGVVCLDGTADPWGPKAVRASAGTVFRIPVSGCELSEAVAGLTARGLRLAVAAADGGPFADFIAGPGKRDRSVAVAVGNEGAGVRSELRDAAHAVVAIEMRGPAESLNVGIAGSILMYGISQARA